MVASRRPVQRWLAGFTLAASLLLSAPSHVFAAPGDTNSVNDGQTVNGGNYYNTPGSRTEFINSKGTGLHLHEGNTVVGREVNGNGELTGNGGALFFNAPGQVVRLDGNIDVRGMNSAGAIVGKGGNVQVDSAFLYQNGQIWANGTSGGVVAFNVGSMTMGPNAVIDASGVTGDGGVVNIKGTGAIDLQKGSQIITSGKATLDTNYIRIEGGLVNLEGILTADGKLPGQSGGTIDVKAVGGSTKIDTVALNNGTGIFTDAEKAELVGRDALLRKGNQDPNAGPIVGALDGSVKVASTAVLSANGANGSNATKHTETIVKPCGCEETKTTILPPTDGAKGGNINLEACKDVIVEGKVTANGGNAGVYAGDLGAVHGSAAGGDIHGQNGANGGDGGTITITYRDHLSTSSGASLQAKGGNGSDGQSARGSGGIQVNGGNGGNGGDGGSIVYNYDPVHGTAPSSELLTSTSGGKVDLSGGQAGKGGSAASCDGGCGDPNYYHPGQDGTPGTSGTPAQNTVSLQPCPTCEEPPPPPPEECTGGDCGGTPPPPSNPPIDGRALYPKEYPRLGEALPPGMGPLVNYNRSVFMARAPLPLVKRQILVHPPVQPTPPAPIVKKVVPPQRKTFVRGHW